MAGENNSMLKGCIKGVKGPWLVHRITKDGRAITKLRYPSERERQNNKRRERERRLVTRKIFSGLRAHGNYHLPKHADSNDILKVLCEEAGWNVDEDGNVSRKNLESQEPSLINTQACQVRLHSQCKDEDYYKFNEACHVRLDHQYKDEDYCKCNEGCQVHLDRQYKDEDYCKCNEACKVDLNRQCKDEDYCKCNENRNSTTIAEIQSRTSSQMVMHGYGYGYEVDLTLSLSP